MFILNAEKARLIVQERELITSGAVSAFEALFTFSSDWDGLSRTAVFRAGGPVISVLLDETGKCTIPWEVLLQPKQNLYMGVYGTRDGTVVLPTIWADWGKIEYGARLGYHARAPTPGVCERVLSELEKKQDKLAGQPGQVAGFDESGQLAALDANEIFTFATDEEVDAMLDRIFGKQP